MLVTMQNSELIDKLLTIAYGDIDLVQRAVRASAGRAEGAALEDVVRYIVDHRRKHVRPAAQRVAHAV